MEGEKIFYSNVRCKEADKNTDRTQFEENEDINNNVRSLNISEKEIFNDKLKEVDEESEQTQLQINGYINNDNSGSTLKIVRVESKKASSNIRQNQLTKEKISNKCEICGKFYASKYSLKYHIDLVHNKIKNIYCDLCNYSTNMKAHIRAHINNRHNQTRSFKCSFEGCSKTFKTKGSANIHLAVHSDVRPFICEKCGKGFKRSDNLSKHRRRYCKKRN